MRRSITRRETFEELCASVKRWDNIRLVPAIEGESAIDAFLLNQRVALRRCGAEPMDETMFDIVARLRAGGKTYPEIAADTGLSEKTVGRIVRGQQVKPVKLERKAVCRCS